MIYFYQLAYFGLLLKSQRLHQYGALLADTSRLIPICRQTPTRKVAANQLAGGDLRVVMLALTQDVFSSIG